MTKALRYRFLLFPATIENQNPVLILLTPLRINFVEVLEIQNRNVGRWAE